MFARISNAWSLAKSSWQVLQHDRELAWLPVIGGIAAIGVALAFFGPFMAMAGGADNDTVPLAGWILVFVGYVAVSSVVFLARAAIVHGANLRMEGGDPSIGSSIRGASAHWPAVVGFAAIATTVGIILDALEEQGIVGAIASWIAGVAWRVITYLTLPVIIIEGAGSIRGIKESGRLVRRTWGEQVTGNVGFGLLNVVLVVPAFLLVALVANIGLAALTVVTVLAAVVWTVGVTAVITALTAIFQTALYRQATGRSVPAEFDGAELRHSITRNA